MVEKQSKNTELEGFFATPRTCQLTESRVRVLKISARKINVAIFVDSGQANLTMSQIKTQI